MRSPVSTMERMWSAPLLWKTAQSGFWRTDYILRSMLQHPEVMEAFNLSLASNLRKMVGMVEELTFYQVTNRMARLIYELLGEQTGCKGASVQITQNLLAARLGTVREVAARSLKELERSGAIQVRRREIQVINWEVLAGWLNDN